MDEGYWIIASPAGERFKFRPEGARLSRHVADVASCDNPLLPMERVYGPLVFIAEVEEDGTPA